ncbi:MAG: hypothetical protein WCG50_10785 [Rhodoferax sp.]
MSKHACNLNRLHSKLLARYGFDDALVVQLKSELDLQKTQSAVLSRWSVSYLDFIKGALQSDPAIASHTRPH